MRTLSFAAAAVVLVLAAPPAEAGTAPAAAAAPPPAPPKTPKAAANIDLTGQWVSVVTEDWRWRMVTPPKGDYTSVPLNAEGRRVADTWDQAADVAAGEQCRPYGAAALLRMPGRLRISWASDDVLKLETDAGTQTRELSFKALAPAAPSWQGRSLARWEDTQAPPSGLGIVRIPAAPPSYALKVVTTGMKPGYLRKNGVPYSGDAVLTEYFDTLSYGDSEWLVVTTVVDDPKYLVTPFVTTTHFKRERDPAKWSPTPCLAVPPTRGPMPKFPQ